MTFYSAVIFFSLSAYNKLFGSVICLVLLQRGADPSIRNTDGKTAVDLADPLSKSVLTGNVTF